MLYEDGIAAPETDSAAVMAYTSFTTTAVARL